MTKDVEIHPEQNGVQHVIDIAIHSSWIGLAIERFEATESKVGDDERARVKNLRVADLNTLKGLSGAVQPIGVVALAVKTTWMALAKEKFLANGGTLDEHEHAALDCIADHELETLQTLSERLKVKASGFTGDAGGIY